MSPSTHQNSVAILGLGNLLLQDDGVGVHVARRLGHQPPAGADVYEIGTALLGALEILEQYDTVIAVDAVCAGGPPGSIYLMDAHDARLTANDSLHDLGLAGALRLLDPARLPQQVLIVGIEPNTLNMGLELSEALQEALPEIIRCVCDQTSNFTRNCLVHTPIS